MKRNRTNVLIFSAIFLMASGILYAAGKTPDSTTSTQPGTARLFYLTLKGGEVLSANPDGSDRKVLQEGRKGPDGVAVDVAARHIFWTVMGKVNDDDGAIERSD